LTYFSRAINQLFLQSNCDKNAGNLGAMLQNIRVFEKYNFKLFEKTLLTGDAVAGCASFLG